MNKDKWPLGSLKTNSNDRNGQKLTRLRWAKTSELNIYYIYWCLTLWQVKIREPCNIYSCEIFQNPGQKRNARYACCGYTSYKTISHLRYLYHSRFHFLPWPKNRRHPCTFITSWRCFQQGLHNSVAVCHQCNLINMRGFHPSVVFGTTLKFHHAQPNGFSFTIRSHEVCWDI